MPVAWLHGLYTSNARIPQWSRTKSHLLSSHAVCAYLSANSGAGIGLAEEALPLFSVAWINESHPEKGFNYLYLSQEIYLKLQDGKKDLTSFGWLKTMWAGAATQDYGRHRSCHFSHCTICWYRSLSCSSREVSSLSGRTTNYPDSSVAP
jgi:hypothetical protein